MKDADGLLGNGFFSGFSTIINYYQMADLRFHGLQPSSRDWKYLGEEIQNPKGINYYLIYEKYF